MYQHIKVPAGGQKISVNADFSLNVPDQPIIPYIEGDGTGFDITPVVGLVTPPFELQIDPFEVAERFAEIFRARAFDRFFSFLRSCMARIENQEFERSGTSGDLIA